MVSLTCTCTCTKHEYNYTQLLIDHGGSSDVVATGLTLVCSGLIEVVHTVRLVLNHIVALGQWSVTHCTSASSGVCVRHVIGKCVSVIAL